jgi:hypothetical protein
MKDFDKERAERHAEREKALGDRSFVFGGETFTYAANVSYDVLRNLTSEVPLAGQAYIDAIEQNVVALIEDEGDAHKRFLKLCKRRKDPITFDDLQNLCTGLVEEAFKRPLEVSLPSTDGQQTTGIVLTESSSTEPEKELVA